MEELNKQELLEVRITNIERIIDALNQELLILLKEYDDLIRPKTIGFKYSKKDNGKKNSQQTPSNLKM